MLKLLVFPFTASWMPGTIPKIPFRRHAKDSCPAPRVLCTVGTPSGKSTIALGPTAPDQSQFDWRVLPWEGSGEVAGVQAFQIRVAGVIIALENLGRYRFEPALPCWSKENAYRKDSNNEYGF
jgi:hypothetical protein